jgi:hypothetical protein
MPEKQRNLMWPVLLIVVGIVLLLVQVGVISIAWVDLWRLWPVLLILIGLDILLGRAKHGWIAFLALAAVIIVAAVAWVLPRAQSFGTGTADMKTEHLAYPVAGAESATVRLEVGAGEVRVETMGDSANLLEADIRYDQRVTTFTASTDTQNGETTVQLHSDTHGTSFGLAGKGEEWDVRLNADVATRLVLNAGVSQATVDLTNATLTGLDVNAGVGDVRVSLPGRGAYSVSVNGGVGSLVLELPEGVEARLRVDGGLGSVDVDSRFQKRGKDYVTAGYDDAEERVEVEIDGGVGSIEVK